MGLFDKLFGKKARITIEDDCLTKIDLDNAKDLILIPSNVKKVKTGSLMSTTDFKGFFFPSTIKEIDCNWVFLRGKHDYYIDNLENWCTIDGNNSCLFARNEKLFLNGVEIVDLVIPNNVKNLKGVFRGMKGLKSITLGTQLEEIEYEKFKGCKNLEKLILNDNLKKIGRGAFEDCENLKEVHVKNLEVFNNIVFEDDTANPLYYGAKLYINGKIVDLVEEVDIAEGTTDILPNQFNFNFALKKVHIPSSVKTIGEKAFCGCANLEEIIIEKGLEIIGKEAFYGCKSLIKVVLPSTVEVIEEEAFCNCKNLNIIKIPKKTTVIGKSAFAITNINTIDLSCVKEIGEWAFASSSLTTVKLNSSLTRIEVGTFARTLLNEIEIPECVNFIGERAFVNSKIKNIHFEDCKGWYYKNNKIDKTYLKSSEIGDSEEMAIHLKNEDWLGDCWLEKE